jgi:hypothetical protein
VQTVGDAFRVYRDNAQGPGKEAEAGEQLSPSRL